MPKIVPIVEGHGETTAVPVLIRKLLDEMGRYDVQVATPKNANGRSKITVTGGLEKFLSHAWNERDCGAVLILMDTEEGCALEVVRPLVERTKAIGVRFPVVIVAANRMYENWFLASLETIRGQPLEGRLGLPEDTPIPQDAEAENGKGYINNFLPDGRTYKGTLDQEAMTRLLDTTKAEQNSRSFKRLRHAVKEAVEAMDTGKRDRVTPAFSVVPAPPAAPAQPKAPKNKR